MYDYSLLAILAAIAIFSKPSEMRALTVFSGVCTLALMLGQHIKDNCIEYYQYHFVLCAALHLLIALKISKEHKITDFIFHIYIINLAFIYLNLFGFHTYLAYINAIYFNTGCEILYSLVLVAAFYKWYCDGLWDSGISWITSFFRSNMRRSIPQLCLSKKEAGT